MNKIRLAPLESHVIIGIPIQMAFVIREEVMAADVEQIILLFTQLNARRMFKENFQPADFLFFCLPTA